MATDSPAAVAAQTPSGSSTPGAAGRPASRRRRRNRARFLVAGLIVVAAIGYMIYAAMQGGSEYFVTASELKAMGDGAIDQPIKLGGRVVEGSVQWDRGASAVSFTLADEKLTLPVTYTGVVPDSFQAGTDVILEGKLGSDGRFQATGMMAKCASKYEPARR